MRLNLLSRYFDAMVTKPNSSNAKRIPASMIAPAVIVPRSGKTEVTDFWLLFQNVCAQDQERSAAKYIEQLLVPSGRKGLPK